MAINKRYLKHGLVAFIDLLGFSARVASLRTSADLAALQADVDRVQGYFDYKTAEPWTRQAHAITSKTILAFSDCLVISVPLLSELSKSEGDFDVLLGEFCNIALAQGRCVMNGNFLRGGASLGLWYRRKDTLISPAMVEAYHIEQCACVPMIALSHSLYKYLSKHKERSHYHPDDDQVPRLFKRFTQLPNGSAHWFLDYFRICLEEIDGQIAASDRAAYKKASGELRRQMQFAAWQKECDHWSGRHRDSILAAFRAATTDSVRAKYVWLATYHDRTIRGFYGRTRKELLVGRLMSP